MKKYIITNSDNSKFLRTVHFKTQNSKRYGNVEVRRIFVDNKIDADVFISKESAQFVADRVEGIVIESDFRIYLLKVGEKYLKDSLTSIVDYDPVTTPIKTEGIKLSFDEAYNTMRIIRNSYPKLTVTFELA